MNDLRNIGVIGDMVGFASAIYQRGVNFIQVCIGECVFNGCTLCSFQSSIFLSHIYIYTFIDPHHSNGNGRLLGRWKDRR